MHKFNNIMIDLETIDTSRTAKLLSIGACSFDINRPPNLLHLFSDTFYVNVGEYSELGDSRLESKFTESEQTKQWWAQQGDAAKQVLEANRVNPREAIKALFNWVRSHGDSPVMWACPPQFDLNILSHHFEMFGLNQPWHWSKERDFRTVREVIKVKNGFMPNEPKACTVNEKTVVFTKHNALHDAIVQADKLQQIVQYMRR